LTHDTHSHIPHIISILHTHEELAVVAHREPHPLVSFLLAVIRVFSRKT